MSKIWNYQNYYIFYIIILQCISKDNMLISITLITKILIPLSKKNNCNISSNALLTLYNFPVPIKYIRRKNKERISSLNHIIYTYVKVKVTHNLLHNSTKSRLHNWSTIRVSDLETFKYHHGWASLIDINRSPRCLSIDVQSSECHVYTSQHLSFDL